MMMIDMTVIVNKASDIKSKARRHKAKAQFFGLKAKAKD